VTRPISAAIMPRRVVTSDRTAGWVAWRKA